MAKILQYEKWFEKMIVGTESTSVQLTAVDGTVDHIRNVLISCGTFQLKNCLNQTRHSC